jgi:hypothetical protein
MGTLLFILNRSSVTELQCNANISVLGFNPALHKEVIWENGHTAPRILLTTSAKIASRPDRFTHLEEYWVSTEQAAKWAVESITTQSRRRKSLVTAGNQNTIRGLLARSVATTDYTRVPFTLMYYYYYYYLAIRKNTIYKLM